MYDIETTRFLVSLCIKRNLNFRVEQRAAFPLGMRKHQWEPIDAEFHGRNIETA